MHKVVPVLVILLAFCGCKNITSLIHDDQVVAKLGEEKLYKSELDAFLPDYLTPEDSLRLSRQYINTWALEHLYMKVAQEQLSAQEKDVSGELEDYRRSLLRFRYEQRYVADRLDTLVTQDQMKDYYDGHQEMFILERPILKVRYLDILKTVPQAAQIEKKMSSDKYESIEEAALLADSLAIKYFDRSDEWMDAMVLAKEFGLEYKDMLSLMSGKSIRLDSEDRNDVRVAYVCDIRRSGVAPLEFCESRIKDIIISARKHNLLSSLEQDLLVDARSRKQFVIY